LPLWLRTYEILATGPRCGLIEVVNDAKSIDEIHRINLNLEDDPSATAPFGRTTLLEYFQHKYCEKTKNSLKSVHKKERKLGKEFKAAQNAFLESLAAYSLVCFVLQIKDRHNQNIMIDDEGHIVHIDFGFLLSNAPGRGLKFEKAPFKLTVEDLEVLGGE
jgi:phosphatidylinositol 4-kinase